jgi:hypothetical protein
MTPTIECPRCQGTGQILDQRELGRELRALRVASQMTLRAMSERLGITATYLCDLELGRRVWSPGRVQEFRAVCGARANGARRKR